jgi:aerobic C4-dicarboxylate transport protein
MSMQIEIPKETNKTPLYKALWMQVIAAIILAVILGLVDPKAAVAMKPLGDAFIRLISMVITLVIFFTVVSGIAGMQDMRKVGRIGGKALLYFEVVSTIALLLGLVIGNVIHPGSSFNVNPGTLDAKGVSDYAGAAKSQTLVEFLLHIVPTTVVDAFAKGDILQVLFIAILFGFALMIAGPRCRVILSFVDALTALIFSVVNLLMRFAPIGAFGAMAFTVGKYGIASLGPLGKFIAVFYVVCILFVMLVLGTVARIAGFRITHLLSYIKEEILLVLATSSSETALPTLMEKLEQLGCSQSLVGLVVPTGYTFNTDGTSLYMTLAALFIAQATHTHLTLTQQLTIFAVAVLTSKGASGVQGAAFIALVGTLMVVPTIPVAGMALILGIDRFMSMGRAVANMVGNAVATLVVARWEHEIGADVLFSNLHPPNYKMAEGEPPAEPPQPQTSAAE